MNRKLFILPLGIAILILIFMNISKEDKPNGTEILMAIENSPTEGLIKLIESMDKVEYLYKHIGNRDHNFARVIFELRDDEVNQLRKLLLKTNFELYEIVDLDNSYIDYTGDGFDYIISYDGISYRLLTRHAKAGTTEVGSGVSIHLWPTNVKEAKELIASSKLGPIVKLSGPLMNSLEELEEFRLSLINSTNDKKQCAEIEILSDFKNDVRSIGEIYVVRRARSVEALHMLEGIVYFDEPVTSDKNYDFDIKLSTNDVDYYINYDEMIFQYGDEIYSIHPKFTAVLSSIISNAEIE